MPALPGDVLLVFGDDDALLAEPERLVLEWWALTTAPLGAEAPASDESLEPFHAVLHRTVDVIDSIFEGTKLGGLPQFIQEAPDLPGTFVAAIGSISVPRMSAIHSSMCQSRTGGRTRID